MKNEGSFYIYRWILSLKAKLSVYEASRYLTIVHQPFLRRSGNFLEDMLNMDEGRFVQHARMSRSAFFNLIDTIKDLPGYNPPNKRRPQEDIRVQVLCVLIRLGNHGNASSIGQIAYKCGVSEGSVSKFTERFFEAILSIPSDYIK
ncbi:hypothetical protein G6F56_004498 [Rhizopus delemar]|nr:hypothetical protein G6F56_004498 [Rhizopus delemar]